MLGFHSRMAGNFIDAKVAYFVTRLVSRGARVCSLRYRLQKGRWRVAYIFFWGGGGLSV